MPRGPLAASTNGVRRRTAIEAQAPEVRRVQTAQTLATRIEDLAARGPDPP